MKIKVANALSPFLTPFCSAMKILTLLLTLVGRATKALTSFLTPFFTAAGTLTPYLTLFCGATSSLTPLTKLRW